MATTLQNIISSLQGSGLLPSAQINGGLTDNLQPPYLNVLDYSHTVDYDTGGLSQKQADLPAYALLDATFKVLIVHASCDQAEELAAQVDAFMNCNTVLTPNCIGCFQTSYKSSQMSEQLYQWGVEIEYNLKEQYGNG